MIGIMVAVFVFSAYFVALYRSYPTPDSHFPKCFFWSLSGWKCPGCGTQRALHLLMHGDVVGSLRMSPCLYFAVSSILLVAFSPRWFCRMWFAVVVAVVTIAFTVLRNIYNW